MVAVARQGRERECRKDIRAIGFACYHPIERATIVRRGRRIHTDRLLLGPYLFVQSQASDAWKHIPSLRHCDCLLMRTSATGTEPALAEDSEVAHFRSFEDRDGYIRKFDRSQFAPGSLVRVLMGAFVGYEARYVVQTKNGDAAEVEIFGRKTRIEFALGALEAA